jgi:signal transduction histidine kinase
MPKKETPPLNDFIADQLTDRVDGLAGEWVEWLSARLGVTRERVVPTEELLDHIPVILRGIADFMRLPVESVKAEIASYLRLLAELRREQGYDVDELLTEFDVMGSIITKQFVELVGNYPGEADPVEVAEISGRMREGLAAITGVAVGAYRQEEAEQKRELARRLSEYAHTLAHELKTPLHSATTAMHMLQEEKLGAEPDEQRRFTELTLRNLKRAFELVDDVRLLALSESAQSAKRWILLQQVVKSVVDTLSDAAERKGVRIEVDGVLPPIDVDAVRVEIALANLLSNGIKYSDPAKEDRWVRIGAERMSGEHIASGWRIWVKDNGVGIPQSLQVNVFQPRFRAHPMLAEGTGLGLALVYTVVVQKGGELSFESTEGEGSTFFMDIPERQVQSEQWGRKQP